MTDREALGERVKELIAKGCGCDRYCQKNPDDCGCARDADAAIDLLMEEAAMIAESRIDPDPMDDFDTGWNGAYREIAAALRAHIKEEKP